VVEEFEDEEGCPLCHGGGHDGAFERSTDGKGSDLQSHRDERLHTRYLGVSSALKHVLPQGEGAEAMPLWVSQGSEPQAVHQLSQRQKNCQLLWCPLP
jgi:hypothetical protein